MVTRIVRPIWQTRALGATVLCVLVGLSAPAVAGPAVTLSQSVHFTRAGADAVVEAGAYQVEGKAEGKASRLTLISAGRPPIQIDAQAATHEEKIETARALVVPEEDHDALHIVLLQPNGQGLDAIGSLSGTRGRGLNTAVLSASQIQLANAHFTTAETPTGGPMVLGTSAQTVQIPGHLNVHGGASGPVMQVLSSQIGGGVWTRNLYIHQLNQRGAPAHLCWRPADDGVQGLLLTTCTTSQSSLRYKMDLEPYAGGMDLVNRLAPVHFSWKNSGLPEIGLVAEEVAAVEPLLTFKNEKDEIEGVKYETLSVVLINALKEQQAEIRALQQQVSALRDQITKRPR